MGGDPLALQPQAWWGGIPPWHHQRSRAATPGPRRGFDPEGPPPPARSQILPQNTHGATVLPPAPSTGTLAPLLRGGHFGVLIFNYGYLLCPPRSRGVGEHRGLGRGFGSPEHLNPPDAALGASLPPRAASAVGGGRSPPSPNISLPPSAPGRGAPEGAEPPVAHPGKPAPVPRAGES